MRSGSILLVAWSLFSPLNYAFHIILPRFGMNLSASLFALGHNWDGLSVLKTNSLSEVGETVRLKGRAIFSLVDFWRPKKRKLLIKYFNCVILVRCSNGIYKDVPQVLVNVNKKVLSIIRWTVEVTIHVLQRAVIKSFSMILVVRTPEPACSSDIKSTLKWWVNSMSRLIVRDIRWTCLMLDEKVKLTKPYCPSLYSSRWSRSWISIN